MFHHHATTPNSLWHFTAKLQSLVRHYQSHRTYVRNLEEGDKAANRLARTAPHCLEDTGLGPVQVPMPEKTSFLPHFSRS